MATAIFKIIFMLVFYLSSSNLAMKSFSLRASIQLFVNIHIIMTSLGAAQLVATLYGVWKGKKSPLFLE